MSNQMETTGKRCRWNFTSFVNKVLCVKTLLNYYSYQRVKFFCLLSFLSTSLRDKGIKMFGDALHIYHESSQCHILLPFHHHSLFMRYCPNLLGNIQASWLQLVECRSSPSNIHCIRRDPYHCPTAFYCIPAIQRPLECPGGCDIYDLLCIACNIFVRENR
jgi:hypothetical protein